MPAALDVNWEAVKTLTLAVGPSEASRQTGISLDAIKQRSARGKWLVAPALPPSIAQPVTGVTAPSAALANTLADRKQKTRMNLSQYAIEASGKAARSKGNLIIAKQVKDVAAIAQVVWPEEQGPAVNIQLLSDSGIMG